MENDSPQNTTIKSYFEPAWTGTLKALKSTIILAKIIIPVTFVLVALDQMNLLVIISGIFAPFLQFFGLPGEAALPLLLGAIINIYAALGAIAVLTFSPREITVIALMILTCHSMLMETPVLKFAGLKPLSSVALRVTGAFLFGIILNLILLALGVK